MSEQRQWMERYRWRERGDVAWRYDRGEWRQIRREATIQAELAARLSWAHGEERALRIIAGKDVETNDDIQAWHGLGAAHG